jgi:hypothetical protein
MFENFKASVAEYMTDAKKSFDEGYIVGKEWEAAKWKQAGDACHARAAKCERQAAGTEPTREQKRITKAMAKHTEKLMDEAAKADAKANVTVTICVVK